MSSKIRTVLLGLILVLLVGLIVLGVFDSQGFSDYGDPFATDCTNTTFQVVVHIYPTRRELIEAYKQTQGVMGGNRMDSLPLQGTAHGFAGMVEGTNQWHLLVLKPRGQNDSARLGVWGHELAHAVCGSWHPQTLPE